MTLAKMFRSSRLGKAILVFCFLSTSTALICNILEYGALPDGVTNNTEAFQKAISACSQDPLIAIEQNQLLIPATPGRPGFLVGSITLCSWLDVRFESGAKILGSKHIQDYPLVPVLPSYGIGRDVPTNMRYQALIFGSNLTNVSLSGPEFSYGDASIDGQGLWWWELRGLGKLNYSRPHLVEFMYSEFITIQDLTFSNSPFWTIHPYASSDILVTRIQVLAPGFAPNTDGVDPDSCSNVEISHSFFSAGDDGIAIKSGLNQAGRDFNMPSQNIYIHNITVKPEFDNGSTNGISIGSEMSGGVRNVTVNGASFHGVFAGLYIKSMDGRGGYVSNVTFMNVNITHTIQAIKFVMEYSYEKNTVMEVMDVSVSGMARPIGSGPAPVFDNFRVLHARGSHISQAGNFYGLSDSPLTNILLDDVVGLITLVFEAALGFNCTNTLGSCENTFPRCCFGTDEKIKLSRTNL